MRKLLLGGIVASLAVAPAAAGDIVVFCPGAVQSVVRPMARTFEEKTGNTVKFEFATAGAVARKVADGAPGDVVLTTDKALAALARDGKVDGGSIKDLGSMGVGVAVKAGAPKPDIHDVDAFRKSMLAAKSIMFANPAKGGQSGIHVAKVFAELGLDKELGDKIKLRDRGPDGLKEVAAGDIEIGLGQISEILANKDVVLVGPLPAAIQGAVTFSGAVHAQAKDKAAAKALIELLTSPEAKEKFRAVGFTVS
ncbi:MAG TPA: substrate-binding domain-containing protein [Pseudolabrys sp.]|nr:substrate-binding domain-containing protein [Pseudolabrys sp.]